MADSTRERMDQIARAIRENNQPGIIAPTVQGWQVTGLTLVANRAYVVRFIPVLTLDVNSISFVVSTFAGANDAVDVGIYDSAMKKIVSSGAQLGLLTSNGAKTVNLPTRVLCQPGVPYYAAFSSGTQGGTAAAIVGSQFASAFLPQIFGASAPDVEGEFMNSGHPLPNSITPGGGATQYPVLAVRRS